MSTTYQSEQSLFASFAISPSDPSSLIDKKITHRMDAFTNETDYTEVKSEKIESDIDLGYQERTKLFRNRRLRSIIPIQYLYPLQSVLQIDKARLTEMLNYRGNPTELFTYSNLLLSPTLEDKLMGVIALTKLIEVRDDKKCIFQDISDSGVVPIIKDFLISNVHELVYYALYFLTNLSFNRINDITEITSQDGLQRIILCLDSRVEEILSQATNLIGNVLEKPEILNELIKLSIIDKLFVILSTTESQNVARETIWTITKIIKKRGINQYRFESVSPILSSSVRWLCKENSEEKLKENALTLINYILRIYKQKAIEFIVSIDILRDVMPLICSPRQKLQLLALKLFGNIIAGNANETQTVLDMGFLDYLKWVLKENTSTDSKIEASWILSNISSGTQLQIDELFKNGFHLEILYEIKDQHGAIQDNLFWALCNLTSSNRTENIEHLINGGAINQIKTFLESGKRGVLSIGLEALDNLLANGEKNWRNESGVNLIVKMVEECGLFDILENIQYSPYQNIYEKVVRLIEKYFDGVDAVDAKADNVYIKV